MSVHEKNDEIISEKIHTCSICYEEIGENESCLLECSHVFHRKCIDNMFKFNMNSCPMCRCCIEGNPVDKFRKCEDYYNSSKNGILTGWRLFRIPLVDFRTSNPQENREWNNIFR